MYQIKVALIKVIKNFRVLPLQKTMDEVVTKKTAFLFDPDGGIHLKFESIVE